MDNLVASDGPANYGPPSAYALQHAIEDRFTNTAHARSDHAKLPRPSPSRLQSSLQDQPICVDRFVREARNKPKEETVLYLAYGSNLQAAKFRGDRGIKPLAQINVQVPSLRMTFDLPGIPYSEPCFANTARRDPRNEPSQAIDCNQCNEKAALLGHGGRGGYRKDAWHKSMIGVVYEVTSEDYAHIIATEGGGAGYQDILVDCHPFVSSDPAEPVPETPTLPSFRAHTLFAPRLPDGEEAANAGGHVQRPDPDYAQASDRYLTIIKEGAAECDLPYEYQDYLASIRPFTITTTKQRMGQFVFLATWAPFVLFVFGLGKVFVDEDGRLPAWMVQLMNAVFRAVWASYDSFFQPIFGDGERTIGDGKGDAVKARRGRDDAAVEPFARNEKDSKQWAS